MARAVDIVDRVGRVLTQLRTSEDPDAEWFAEGLALWLAGAPFDGALGLSGGWRDTLQHRQQQAALAAIRGGLAPMSTRAAATAISGLINRYETTAWQTDRASGRRPPGATGHLWDYLAARGPTSPERVRKLLPWVTETDAMTHRAA